MLRNERDAIRVGRRGSRLIPHSHFRVPRSAEPGAAHGHAPARDAARYHTLAALGYRSILTLTDSEIAHTPHWAAARIVAFLADPARAGDPTPELLPQGVGPAAPQAIVLPETRQEWPQIDTPAGRRSSSPPGA